MYDRLFFFLFISICITFINTDDNSLSKSIKNLDKLDDLVKLTTEGVLTSEDFRWWSTFPDKSDLELFVENKCQIPLLRKCNYKIKMFIGIIWNGSLSTKDMIDIRKRVLQYILDCDLKHMITIRSSLSFNNYIQDSFKDYYEKSSNTGAINVAYIFTNYPNEMLSNDSDSKIMEELSNLTFIIQEQQISTHVVHYTGRGVLVMTYNESRKLIIDNQFKCRELGFNTRKNGTFCDKDMAEVTNLCKTLPRHYSVVVPALDGKTNLDESLNHIINISLSCNTTQSTNKFVLVRTDDYEEFTCQDKDSCQNMWSLSKLGSNRIAPRWANWPVTNLYTNNDSYREDVLFYLTIALTRGYNYGLYSLYIFTNKICSKPDEPLQDVYSGLLKEFFDELRSLLGELNLDANWISLYDHSTNSTCDPSMVAPEQENFRFYHHPLNATTEDIGSLIVCPTTAPSEIFVPTTGLEDAPKSTMISDSSTTNDISSTKNIINKSPDTSEESKKNLWWFFILIPIILIITIAVIIILCLRSTNKYVGKFRWPLNK